MLQLIMLIRLDEDMLVVNIFDDEVVIVLLVDSAYNSLNGRVAFD